MTLRDIRLRARSLLHARHKYFRAEAALMPCRFTPFWAILRLAGRHGRRRFFISSTTIDTMRDYIFTLDRPYFSPHKSADDDNTSAEPGADARSPASPLQTRGMPGRLRRGTSPEDIYTMVAIGD